VVVSVQPTVIGAAQGIERSKFKHDRLLWMGAMIQQHPFDKKRKKCRIPIECFDADAQDVSSLHRLTA
jgi:hypothetical protein